MIRKTSKGYVVFSENGKKLSRPYATKEEAEKRLKQIEYFKHKKDSVQIHSHLNEKLWDSDRTLKKEVVDKISEIVEKFKNWILEDEIEISVNDVVIVGSNASYNYTAKSDLDVHIIVNETDKTLLKTFDLYKAMFNDTFNIKFNGIRVELYVQNDINDIHSNGIYSIDKGWIKEPIKENIVSEYEKDINEEAKKFIDRYEELVKKPDVDKIQKLLDDIYKLRRVNNQFVGEYSFENLVFKSLRDLDIINKLINLKHIKESEELSITDSKGVKDMTINGTMKKFEPKDLINKVKERRESLHTNRTWGKDLYVISVDAFGTVEKPESVYVDIIKIKGKKQERLHLEKFNTWEEAEKFLEEFKQKIISNELKELELSHLKEVIKKLNSPSAIDGEEYNSLFDFDYRIEEDKLYIYDKNEAYSINYLEEKQGNLYEAWEEFGKPKGQSKPDLSHVVDEVHEQLEKAVKEDLGEDSILEWENNVVMVVGIPELKFEDSCTFLENDLSKKHEKINEPKTNTTAVSDEKFDYDKFLVKNHLGEHEYGLSKEDFEDYPEDYEKYPKSEWISRSEWEEFKNKSEDPYWYTWEMLIDQYLDGQANTTEEAIELAKQHPEDLKVIE